MFIGYVLPTLLWIFSSLNNCFVQIRSYSKALAEEKTQYHSRAYISSLFRGVTSDRDLQQDPGRFAAELDKSLCQLKNILPSGLEVSHRPERESSSLSKTSSRVKLKWRMRWIGRLS